MKTMNLTALLATGAILSAGSIVWASQRMSATTDVNGKERAATAQIDGPSTIRCTSAAGQAGEGEKPSCKVAGPGFSGTVEIGKTAALDSAGMVRLTCNGQPPLRCTAEITP